MLRLECEPINEYDRAKLTVLAGSDEFKIFLEKIVEPEVSKFNTNALNSNMTDKDDAFAKLMMAKVAAQIYQGIISKLNSEIEIYKSGKIMPTTALDDLEELASSLPPSLLGEVGGDI